METAFLALVVMSWIKMVDAQNLKMIGKIKILYVQNGIQLEIVINVLLKPLRIAREIVSKLTQIVLHTLPTQENVQTVTKVMDWRMENALKKFHPSYPQTPIVRGGRILNVWNVQSGHTPTQKLEYVQFRILYVKLLPKLTEIAPLVIQDFRFLRANVFKQKITMQKVILYALSG